MEWKIVAGAIFTSIFLLSAMFEAQLMVPANASITHHPAQSIWVDPEFIDDLQKYDVFTIDVMVNITNPPGPGTGLYGWDYKLKWNSSVLELTSYTIHVPSEWGINWFKPKDVLGQYPDGADYHWLGVSTVGGPPPPVTGVRSLCTYNFRVIYQPYYPELDYNGTLDLQDTKLADDTGSPIPHTTYDGEYHIPALLLSPDINLDGIVDILDVVLAAVAFGSKPGDPKWNLHADLNADDLVDIFDMVIIGINYGKTG